MSDERNYFQFENSERSRDPLLLNRYQLLAKLGEDETTVTLKGGRTLLNKFIVIKMLKCEFRDNQQAKDEFNRGIQSEAAGVNSSVYDSGLTEDGRPFTVGKWLIQHFKLPSSELTLEQQKRLIFGDYPDESRAPSSAVLAPPSPRTVSFDEQKFLDKLAKDSINQAREIVPDLARKRKLATSSDVLGDLHRALNDLRNTGLRSAWQICLLLVLTSDGGFHGEEEIIFSTNQALEGLAYQFGEQSLRAYLIEYFEHWLSGFEDCENVKLGQNPAQPLRTYANRELGIAFEIAMDVNRADLFMTNEEKKKRIHEIEARINAFANAADETCLPGIGGTES